MSEALISHSFGENIKDAIVDEEFNVIVNGSTSIDPMFKDSGVYYLWHYEPNNEDYIVRAGTNITVGMDNPSIATAYGITSDKIVEGNTIFGVEGSAAIAIDVPTDNRTFTSNGTFIAPYDGIYTIILNAPIAKAGNGGAGGYSNGDNGHIPGCGGGAGGSSYLQDTPIVISVLLNSQESVVCTVNTSVTSFGEFASISAGSNGRNGGSGSADRPGNGGGGGSKPIFTAPSNNEKIITRVLGSTATLSLSGQSGTDSFNIYGEDWDGYTANMYAGGNGGQPFYGHANTGGAGGRGGTAWTMDQALSDYENLSRTNGASGSAAKAGSIIIVCGTIK